MKRSFLLVLLSLAGLVACQQNDLPDHRDSPLQEKATAERLASGDYRIHINDPAQYYVFLGPRPEKIDWKHSIAATDGSRLNVQNPEKEKRMFFGLVTAGDTSIISERQIPFRGAPNFRDLGGLPTRDGRHVAWGQLFRSGDLSDLTQRDLDYFARLGIQTVIDLRTDYEVEQQPDRFPTNSKLQYLRAPVGTREGSQNPAMLVKWQNEQPPAVNATMMLDTYTSFARIASDYKPVFDALLRNEATPLLIHGAAGKDRTGFGAALILYALGVDKEKIMEDYLLSAHYLDSPSDDSHPQARYLEAAFNAIEEEYGSIDALLAREFGLTDARRKRLQQRLSY